MFWGDDLLSNDDFFYGCFSHIGSAVSKNLRYRQTDTHKYASNLFLLYKDIKIVGDFLKLCLSRFIFAYYISLAPKNTLVRAYLCAMHELAVALCLVQGLPANLAHVHTRSCLVSLTSIPVQQIKF